MNKTDLIAKTAVETGMTRREAEAAVNAALGSIISALSEGERVQLAGFGTFEPKDRPAHTVRNPRTQEPVEVGASRVVVFRPGKGLKEAVALP